MKVKIIVMTFFILMFTFCDSSLSYAYEVDFKQWELVEGNDNLKVYSHKKEKGYKLSIQLKEVKFKDWTKASGEKVYDSIIERKKKMLGLLGIKNWQVHSKKWTPQGKISRLEIKGEYTNSRDQKVEFVEVHEFAESEKRQYLFTRISS